MYGNKNIIRISFFTLTPFSHENTQKDTKNMPPYREFITAQGFEIRDYALRSTLTIYIQL